MDDDDDFLYAGAPTELPAQPPTSAPAASAPELDDPSSPPEEPGSAPAPEAEPSAPGLSAPGLSAPGLSAPAAPDAGMDVENEGNGDDAGSTVDDEEEEESDDDIEIIIDAPARSLDFRRQAPAPAASSAVRLTQAKPPPPPAPALTTEYTPIQRDAAIPQRPPPPTPALVVPPVSAPLPAAVPALTAAPPSKPDPTLSALQAIQAQLALATQQQQPAETPPQDDVDTSKLPVARAPASHPPLNPDGVLNLDLAALAPDKPWRRPGADISDWFNYGFDEISWEAYVYRRKEVGDLGQLLKEKVVSYAQMEDTQVAALPPEFRQMVIAGTFAPPAPMGVPVGVGVPGADMHNPFAHAGFAHDDGSGGAGMMMPDFAAMHDPTQQMQPGPGMFPQQQQQQQQQQGVPAVAAPTPVPAQPRAPPTGPSRGIPGAPRAPAALLRGGYVSRGGTGRPPPTGPRAASPLPPNVPTGPRAANRYKDRDGIAAASDGLDYGGGGGGGGAAGARGEDERERDRDRDRERDRDRDRERDRDRDRDREHERAGSRKRRAASPEESGRASKRR